jgi:transketolase N-terminal domain/subunit
MEEHQARNLHPGNSLSALDILIVVSKTVGIISLAPPQAPARSTMLPGPFVRCH